MTQRSKFCIATAGLLMLLHPLGALAQVDSVILKTGALRAHLNADGPLLSSLGIPGPCLLFMPGLLMALAGRLDQNATVPSPRTFSKLKGSGNFMILVIANIAFD